MKRATVQPALPLLRWAGHHQASVILLALSPVPSPVATLRQPKDLDLELEVLLACTVHSTCPWPTAIALLVAPTFTTLSAQRQTGNSHQFLPCLLTTRASITCQTEARQARLAVATTAPARHLNTFTIQRRGLICTALSTPALALLHQFNALAEHLPLHLHLERFYRLIFHHPLNSRLRSMHLPQLRSSLLWFPSTSRTRL